MQLGGLSTFLVFVVMAVQYNSLIDPLVIMFTIPLALAGGIFGLFIEAAPQRLRPILMTAITTALGLFPRFIRNWRRFRVYATSRNSSVFRVIAFNTTNAIYYSLLLRYAT